MYAPCIYISLSFPRISEVAQASFDEKLMYLHDAKQLSRYCLERKFSSKHVRWTGAISFCRKRKSPLEKNLDFLSESVLRKHKWNTRTRFSQRKRCGNAKHYDRFSLSSFPLYPPCGNITESWSIVFPSFFRISETPFFTLCKHCFRWICYGRGCNS